MKKFFLCSILSGCFLSLATVQAEEVDFEKQVYPLFKASCVTCHRPTYEQSRTDTRTGKVRTRARKPRAGIILSTKEGIMTSVDENEKLILKAGDPDGSRLLAVTKLPLDDDYHFPPPGKAPQWTKEDIALVAKWIEQGAKFGDWTGDEEPNEGLEWDDKEKTEELQKAVDQLE